MKYVQKHNFLLAKIIFSLLITGAFSAFVLKKGALDTPPQKRPNIIIFYIDDLGYGDIGYNGAVGVKTPVIDKLAKEGIVFTDAHSTAATCTPSRYSLLTGEYAFRNKAAILPGDAPLLIKPGSFTLPNMLKKAGYATGVVGKWHLGLGNGNINWNGHIKPGPSEIGFDYSFLLPATGDRVPTVYLENQRVLNANPNDPIEVSYELKLEGYHNGIDNPELLKQRADKQHSNTSPFSPVFKAMAIKNDTVTLTFDKAPNGLTAYGKELSLFEIAGADKVFYPAKATITQNGINLKSESVPQPIAVRYAFKNFIVADLFGTNGLPVSSFRTDDWAREK